MCAACKAASNCGYRSAVGGGQARRWRERPRSQAHTQWAASRPRQKASPGHGAGQGGRDGKGATTGAIPVACCHRQGEKFAVNQEIGAAQPAGEFPSRVRSTASAGLPEHVSNEEVFPFNHYNKLPADWIIWNNFSNFRDIAKSSFH
jgi:hypothetical protein